MFRVPFIMGRQDDNVVSAPAEEFAPAEETPGSTGHFLAAPSAARLESQASLTDGGRSRSTSPIGRRSSLTGQVGPIPVHSDPWGLERSGQGIQELGCRQSSEVA